MALKVLKSLTTQIVTQCSLLALDGSAGKQQNTMRSRAVFSLSLLGSRFGGRFACHKTVGTNTLTEVSFDLRDRVTIVRNWNLFCSK